MNQLQYFKPEEFECKCGCGMLPDWSLMRKCDVLRRLCGVPLFVHSGARCVKHNKSVGGAEHSFHVKGLAVDLRWPAVQEQLFILNAGFVGFRGIGLYNTFVHLDSGPNRIWQHSSYQ